MERSRDLSSDNAPPTSGVDTRTQPIDRAPTPRDHRTNKPVKLRRTAADQRRRKHRELAKLEQRWHGGAFAPSVRRERELDDLRTWEGLDCGYRDDVREHAIGGTSLLGIRNAGKVAPFPHALTSVALRIAIGGDFESPCGELTRIDCVCCTKRERSERRRLELVLAWLVRVAIAPVLDRQYRWVIARHVDVGRLLGCGESYAARAMRWLCEHGFVRRVPLYDEDPVVLPDGREYMRHVRGPCAYAPGDRTFQILGIASLPEIRIYQASALQGDSSLSEPGPTRTRTAHPGHRGTDTPTTSPAPAPSSPLTPATPADGNTRRATIERRVIADTALERKPENVLKPENVPDETTDALTALGSVKTRTDTLRRPEGEHRARSKPHENATRVLAAKRRREPETAALIQRNAERKAEAKYLAKCELMLRAVGQIVATANPTELDGAAAAARAEILREAGPTCIARERVAGLKVGRRPSIADDELHTLIPTAEEYAELRRSVSPLPDDRAAIAADDEPIEAIAARVFGRFLVDDENGGGS